MLVSRLRSQAAAFSAALVVAGVGFAQAATTGGASLTVTGAVQTTITPSDDAIEDGFATITSEGEFIAQNMIADFNAPSAYVVKSDLTAGGREFFDTSFEVTPGEINAILGGFGGDIDDVAPFLTALVTGPDGSIVLPPGNFFSPIAGLEIPGVFTTPPLAFFDEFEGLEIFYSFDVNVATTEELSGTFSVSSTLSLPQLQLLETSLVSAFGPISFEDAFDFEFNASIAPVPLPAGLPMLLGGLVLLGWLGRRRRIA